MLVVWTNCFPLIHHICRFFGYCNSFGWSDKPRGKATISIVINHFSGSVGLGASIGESFDEFVSLGTPFTSSGTKTTNGNGSIMRNGAIPLFFANCIDDTLCSLYHYSRLQSLTTHQGTEASECCALLSHICMAFIQGQLKTIVLTTLEQHFSSPLYSIMCLAKGIQEETHPQNAGVPLHTRNWNWRDKHFSYSLVRAAHSPGYIGSYCMDALGMLPLPAHCAHFPLLAMALHCIWSTSSFDEALLKASNLRGKPNQDATH